MCTAVDGGSIHRIARRISAASDQRSTVPMTSHRTKDPRMILRSEVLGCVLAFRSHLRIIIWGWVALIADHRVLPARATRAKAPSSCITIEQAENISSNWTEISCVAPVYLPACSYPSLTALGK